MPVNRRKDMRRMIKANTETFDANMYLLKFKGHTHRTNPRSGITTWFDKNGVIVLIYSNQNYDQNMTGTEIFEFYHV